MHCLSITKPIRLKGRSGYELKITEGPIIIKLDDNYERKKIHISELQINFDYSNLLNDYSFSSKKKKKEKNFKNVFLFKIFPGSVLFIEDCDFSIDKDAMNNKFICFQLNPCLIRNENLFEGGPTGKFEFRKKKPTVIIDMTKNVIDNYGISEEVFIKNYQNITVLNLISTKIARFYQTIRGGENSIVNIEKNFITNNIGKSLVLINPLFLKVSESIFENNYENTIHCKFVKDQYFIPDPRRIIIEKNEISFNHSTGIYIDGIENHPMNLDILILDNIIKNNKVDGIFICEAIVNFLLISDNKIFANKSNGINIYKVYQKYYENFNNMKNNENNLMNFIIIKNNELVENAVLGLMLNFTNSILHNNSFISNASSGCIICNFDFSIALKNKNDANKSKNNFNNENNNFGSNNNSSTKGNTHSLSNSSINCIGVSIVIDCTFNRNHGNGLKILNYNNITYIKNSRFSENREYGLFLENDMMCESNQKKPSKGKVIWNTNKALEINSMDFSKINNWFENIIKTTKNMFNKNPNKNELTNTINFDITKFLKENVNAKYSLNFKGSFSCENILSIFSEIRKIIKENLFNFPVELKDLIFPYIALSNSNIENNSKSGIHLSNCILNTEGNVIAENVKYSIYILKEELKEFYLVTKNKKNSIEGNIGGEWGNLHSDSFCNCFNPPRSARTKNVNDENDDDKENKKKRKNCEIF